MPFNYNPEEQIEEKTEFKPWPAGEYNFEVTEATEQVSKAGNPMIKLRLKVFNDQGHERTQFDYLVSNVTFKIKNFCSAVGLDYAAAAWDAADCVGRGGKLKLGIEPSTQTRDKNGIVISGYPEKNKVASYIDGAPKSVVADLDGDLVPF